MKYENGEIKIRLYDLVEELSKEHRDEIIDALACVHEVIEEVANQLIDGFTSLGSHGPKGGGAHTTYAGLDHAIRRIAIAANDIAAKEIRSLTDALKRAEATQQVGWNAYHELLESRRF